MVDELR